MTAGEEVPEAESGGHGEEPSRLSVVPSPARASAARRTIDALSAGVDVFEDFFENVRVGLALADLTTRYIRVNATYAALLGRAPYELIGVPFSEVVHPD